MTRKIPKLTPVPANELAAKTSSKKPNWWKTSTCYQVWPASYKDASGDGLGDIPGIISKLDYIRELGVDILWLSPMYASPQYDMGYDISNYEDIYPPYGTLADMDTLIKGCHDRGLRIILDLVINHTSDEHAWFQESKQSRDNPKADWYIWKDPKYVNGVRQPPNNWGAMFGGSAWEYVAARDQYYLHLFVKQQPDLNWECKDTREAIYNSALRFWLRKGVDGFRVDTANLYSKDQRYPDGPVDPRFAPYGSGFHYFLNGPRIHEFHREIRTQVLDPFGDVMMVGELAGSSYEQIMKYVSASRHELNMVFDFDLVGLGGAFTNPPHLVHGYKLPEMKTALAKVQRLVADTDAWGTVFAENHDVPRSISRHATTDPRWHDKAGKVLAMLLGSLSGTLFIYQGQEIGMTNIPLSWGPEDLKDVASINYWNQMVRDHPTDKALLHQAWVGIVARGRDNARTPVQWDGGRHAGFSTAEPWMRVNDNYTHINVATQQDDADSILSMWKRVLVMRKRFADIFTFGTYQVHDYDNLSTYTFTKEAEGGKVAFVALNFSTEEREVVWPGVLGGRQMVLYLANVAKLGEKLGPWEGRIYVEE